MRKHIRTSISWIRILALDIAIISLAWVGAFLIRFDGTVPAQYHRWLFLLLPVVILLRLTCLFICGAYWGRGGSRARSTSGVFSKA